MQRELVQLAQTIVWPFLEEHFGEVYQDGSDIPSLPTRLGILKHTFNLSGWNVRLLPRQSVLPQASTSHSPH